MNDDRLDLLIERIRTECLAAMSFVEGMELDVFLDDSLVQHGVAMCFIAIGEYVAKIAAMSPPFVQDHPHIPWTEIVGMRNRIAHGYYALDFEVVWDTVMKSIPELLAGLPGKTAED